MLHKIYSDLSSFKTVIFHKGLNLVIAEKHLKSTDMQTRNGAGKSSLVELINSLLGSDLRKGNVLKTKELVNQRFGLVIDLDDEDFVIERSGSTPSKIYLKSEPSLKLKVIEEDGELLISNDDWISLLGSTMFDLNDSIRKIKSGPTFRSLFAYFARSTKGFDSPEKTFAQQPTGSVQVALTYLLKLNWKIAREFEDVRQKDKLIKVLKKASNEGVLGDILGSASDLRTEILLKKAKANRHKTSLLNFRVLPEYQEREARASDLSRRLSSLSAEDSTDKEWLAQIERALENETEPDYEKVQRLFIEAELNFPEMVIKRFDEVAAFHDSVIKNRKSHLKQEITEITSRINIRFSEKQRLDDEKSEILKLLQSHGALDQYMKLQGALSKLEADIEQLSKKLEATDNLDEKKSELKIKRHNLQKEMRIDHTERDKAISDAILFFAEISGQLYEEPGKFIIDPSDNGPKFEFDIPGKKSTGKNKMQIFCFDMTLMKLWSNEKNRPDILIHDSVIFDGVDERQRAKALLIGAEMAEKYNFQYIVTLNSDDVPDMSAFESFKLENYLVDLKINDTPSGGLFGLKFD